MSKIKMAYLAVRVSDTYLTGLDSKTLKLKFFKWRLDTNPNQCYCEFMSACFSHFSSQVKSFQSYPDVQITIWSVASLADML